MSVSEPGVSKDQIDEDRNLAQFPNMCVSPKKGLERLHLRWLAPRFTCQSSAWPLVAGACCRVVEDTEATWIFLCDPLNDPFTP